MSSDERSREEQKAPMSARDTARRAVTTQWPILMVFAIFIAAFGLVISNETVLCDPVGTVSGTNPVVIVGGSATDSVAVGDCAPVPSFELGVTDVG